MNNYLFIVLAIILLIISCKPAAEPVQGEVANTLPIDLPPAWAKEVIWYEIAVERFRNGDPTNDPAAKDIQGAYPGFVPEGWSITPWTHDWYEEDTYMSNIGNQTDFYGRELTNFVDKVQMRRYGGDLQGVLDKMDYIDSLGVTAIYFRPLNDAPSLHKYDTRNWRHIDRNFGPDPKKDQKTIAAEIPEDPSTWKFTEADKMFLKIIDEFHARGIKVILDYSWNHTGQTFWAWQDVKERQEQSQYKDWYWVDSFDNPNTTENEFKYHGWSGVYELPEIRETQKQDLSVRVQPFEGNIYSNAAKQHILNVTKRWLDPNGDGDPSDGVDGFRLDVAAEMPLGFWRDFRTLVREINPNAFLLGEIWWEEWPDKLLDPAPFLKGDVFDAVMNYRWYRSVRYFFNNSPYKIPATELIDSLKSYRNNLRRVNNRAMMNYTGGFDTPRVITSLFNQNKYKYRCKVHENPEYKIHKPDTAAYRTLKLLLAQQYTYIGAPQIWAGDEMGMWGADDPSCRKPLIWSDYTFQNEEAHPLGKDRPVDKVEFNHSLFEYYQKVIKIRKENPVLIHGQIEFLQMNDEEVLAYHRYDAENEIIVVLNANFNTITLQFPLRKNKIYRDILYNTKVRNISNQPAIEIPARTAVILKAEKL
jgi:glycosidase